MLKTKKIIVPFTGQELISIESSLKDELCFLGPQVMSITNHKNLSQALKDADCKLGVDYVVLERRNHPVIFQELIELNSSPMSLLENSTTAPKKNPKQAKAITIVYESGFWQLSLNSKLPNGKELRKWLSSEVLPSIRKSGKFVLSTIDGGEILTQTDRAVQIENSKKINAYWYERGGVPAIAKYNAENCLQVSGKYPNQIQGKENSAKEKLRKTKPELAATMSLNDSIIVQNDIKLSDLKEVDKVAVALFLEFEKLGIKVLG